MRSCTLLCDSSRLLIYHKSEPRTPVLLESGVLGILVRAFQVLQHHRTYLLSYTPGFATYVCMYVCSYGCMHVHVWFNLCMYVFMIVCIYLRIFGCMYVCMYVCMHACMYVCMYVCTICTHLRQAETCLCSGWSLNLEWPPFVYPLTP